MVDSNRNRSSVTATQSARPIPDGARRRTIFFVAVDHHTPRLTTRKTWAQGFGEKNL